MKKNVQWILSRALQYFWDVDLSHPNYSNKNDEYSSEYSNFYESPFVM